MTLEKLSLEFKEELSLQCETANSENTLRFMCLFSKFKEYIPIHLTDEYDELEELYNDISVIIDVAYNAGYNKK